MKHYPVHEPSRLEMMLFDAGLVVRVPLAVIYDIKARTSIQRTWQRPEVLAIKPDVHDPQQWNDKFHASMRGEFFAYVLQDCRRVLDIGCGEGWPSLYLARSRPCVVGLDLSPEHVALAANTARLMVLDDVRFLVAQIEALPFPPSSFDGVCFGGNVFTYSADPRLLLREVARVLRAGGPFAFEQWPIDPERPRWERVQWFIDGGPPILHYGAGVGLYARDYMIEFDPASSQGQRLARLAERMEGEISEEQRHVCAEIVQELLADGLGSVVRALYAGEDRSLAADEFPSLLEEAGFTEVTSWALPDAVRFAASLHESGLLERLGPDDLVPYLRALVSSAGRAPGWAHSWVTCRKG